MRHVLVLLCISILNAAVASSPQLHRDSIPASGSQRQAPTRRSKSRPNNVVKRTSHLAFVRSTTKINVPSLNQNRKTINHIIHRSIILSATTPSEFEDALFLERFKRRRDESSQKIQTERLSRPPSNSKHFDDPRNVVTSILRGLLQPHDPLPYFGYEILHSSSTDSWKDVLRKSVGAPEGTEEALIYRALSASMEREGNQFGILVGLGTDTGDYGSTLLFDGKNDNNKICGNSGSFHDATKNYITVGPNNNDNLNGGYMIEFPWDTLDYYDGTAWLECRLRHIHTDELLVVLGWSMQRRESDGSWLIDGIDWQDFREKYRPGIGREEWERICG